MIPGEQRPTARDTIVFVPHLSAIVELGERKRERERERNRGGENQKSILGVDGANRKS